MSGTLTINLGAIQSNWQLLAKQLNGATEAGAVVKADGYGLGAGPVTKALYNVGCRTFFVATFDEAMVIKNQLDADSRIFILTGLRPADIPASIEANFIPVLSSLTQCQQWADGCQRLGAQAFSAIKVDTGMHRLGMDERELKTLIEDDKLLLSCSPILLMSHLACAELPDHPLNQQQLSAFQACAAQVRQRVPNIALSLANSSGVFLGDDYQFDLVRPGVCLYGVNPTPYTDNPMRPVVELTLPILQIKTVQGPASVGYDATYAIEAGAKRRLAIVAGGYADGVFVHLSNRGTGLLAGQLVPIVGRVSMDSTIFDISAVDELVLTDPANQRITVINQQHDVDQLAREAGTIGYEVLTSLGQRYYRRYLNPNVS